MNELISVIIPVYNVKPFLQKCVDSVINQTYKNLEIILVDDGSTDGSSIICDNYKIVDNRIIVVHQKNSGLSVARNAGIDICHGKWVAFLDSDDFIEPEMYEVLYKTAIHTGTLISACAFRGFYSYDALPNVVDTQKEYIFDIDTIIKKLFLDEQIRFMVWNKLFNRDLIGEVRFIPNQVSEDIHFDRILFLRSGAISYIDKTMHNYLLQRSGNTNSSFKLARMCIFDEFKSLIEELRQSNKQYLIVYVEAMIVKFSIRLFIEACNKKQDKLLKSRIHDIFDSYYIPVKGSGLLNKYKLLLFHLFPTLYWLLSKYIARAVRR